LIIDVRAAETYSSGHIAGAISFPEADVDARIAELPKDKLIVAYCQ
jgi:rhodanese-related sulfurtransferase